MLNCVHLGFQFRATHCNIIYPKCDRLKINNKGNETPVADADTLVEIAWLLPGKKSSIFQA